MKCQNCGKNNADTHIKRVINGAYEEHHLCAECAKKLGYSNMFSGFADEWNNTFNSLLGGFFSNALPVRSQATRCDTCGSSFADITDTGSVGCADCYDLFEDQLMPTIRRIHGNTSHVGKSGVTVKNPISEKAEEEPDKHAVNTLEELKAQLQTAIENQEFEKAAELRDKIKAKENGDE